MDHSMTENTKTKSLFSVSVQTVTRGVLLDSSLKKGWTLQGVV